MSMSDPIADLLVRLRNGAQARKEYVDCPWSLLKQSVVRVMLSEGFFQEVSVVEKGGAKQDLRIWLRYDESQRSVITGPKRISRPSRRDYVGVAP